MNNTFTFASGQNILTFETIKVQLGDEPVNYVLGQTTAPQAYDGFGTISVLKTQDVRIVLVREEHFTWQNGRYNSGMFYLTPYENRDGVIQHLWARFNEKASD